ncbi:histidinol-phosphate transaminase [Cohnella fermenti]|uniref:Histidinol-phosphate aminotransferase n=1 Tax=Cohnella fermenti TaxID=2565925 RepID=A0A4S4BTQ5_9BACL|nr:histidinol-phosphate transaminase [Cohnella fermenti]THF78422.1 histidinol-phosphate transaminase [Cohnella fermenti]
MTSNPNRTPNIPPASARAALDRMTPYTPGKPIWEVKSEYGLDRIVKLASNENPLGPSPKALEAIREMLPELHRYPDDRARLLVRTLAKRYGLPEGCFLATNGGDEFIKLLSEAYLEPGDEVIVPTPTFSEYEFGAILMDANIVGVPLRDGCLYSADDLLARVGPRTKLVYVCTPNNPTGTYLAKTELRRLVEGLPSGVLVAIDAAYSHYASADDYTDGMELIAEGFPVVVLHTFSKIFGLAGIRVGFGAAPEAVVASILRVKEPFNVNALAQAAALAALDDEEHMEASRALNERGRRQLYEGLAKLSIACVPSMSNFVLAEIGESAPLVYEQLLKRGVIVRPGRGWGLPRCLRISVGTEEENAILLEQLAVISIINGGIFNDL